MSLIRFQHPFDELAPFSKIMDKMINKSFPTLTNMFGSELIRQTSYPKIDIIDKDTSVLLRAALPGHTKEDVDISVENDLLTIFVKSKNDSEVSEKDYYYREIKMSHCQRSVCLPDFLEKDTDKISATFENGVLNVTIPKKVTTEKPIKTNKVLIS